MARRHGRPEPVTPRQVVSTFLESERARRDSGVLGMNGILIYEVIVGLEQGYEDRVGRSGLVGRQAMGMTSTNNC